MIHQLPLNVKRYAESPVFTEKTTPKKLVKVHTTKKGAWGRLVVLEGALDYIISGPNEKSQRLSPDIDGVIKPEEPHRVAILGPVRFKIEFYR